LFSDRARSATVVAQTDVELWRLTKEKFDDLIEENPWLISHFTQVIGDRLYEVNQQLSKIQAAFNLQIEGLFRGQPPACRELLTRTAVLRELDTRVVQDLAGHDGTTATLATLEANGAFVSRRDGVLAYPEAVREFLLARLTAAVGAEGVRGVHRDAAGLYERLGRLDQAIDHYLDAGECRRAAELLAQGADEFLGARRFELLRRWIRQLPEPMVGELLPNLQRRIEEALQPQTAETLPARPKRFGAHLISAPVRAWGGAAVGIAAALAVGTAAPLPDLTAASMHMLALLVWAVVFWSLDILPDYVVGIGLIIGWILLRIVPSEVAVSGFTTSPFFLIIGVLGIAASLQSSGLLFRLGLQILRRFPLTYCGQACGLALSGTVISPGIPDVTSGVAIAGPIILALSDSLGYGRRSRGSAGLAMAALLGFGQMSPFFLTGAAENLLAWGLLPEAVRAQVSWGMWAVVALPLAVVTFLVGFAATMVLFPPEFQPTISRGLIGTQIEALGRPSRAEIVNAVVLVGAVIGWITAPYHGVDVAWVAMSGMAVLLAANLLDRPTFRSGIYWDFLFYLGAVLSLSGVVQHLGFDHWMIDRLAPLLDPVAVHPTAFLLLMALAVFAARFILPSFPLVSLLTVTLVPIGARAGIHPLVLVLVICTTVAVWFLPYQSTYYLALYFGTKERAFGHGQVRGLAWTYGLIYLLAILAAIPYWKLLHMVP
jgi:anion transporter